jgi:hypothetical protein
MTASTILERSPASHTAHHNVGLSAPTTDRRNQPTRTPRRHSSTDHTRSTTTTLFRIAAIVVLACVTTSIVGLIVTVPGVANVSMVSSSAAAFGLLGMYSVVAATTLAFVAAVRDNV